jgi:hypothetical protein
MARIIELTVGLFLIALIILLFVFGFGGIIKFFERPKERMARREAVRLLADADTIMGLIAGDMSGNNNISATNHGRVADWQRRYQRELTRHAR